MVLAGTPEIERWDYLLIVRRAYMRGRGGVHNCNLEDTCASLLIVMTSSTTFQFPQNVSLRQDNLTSEVTVVSATATVSKSAGRLTVIGLQMGGGQRRIKTARMPFGP